jgi:hypothetical protein
MLKAVLAKFRILKPTRETLARLGLLAVVVAAFCLPVVAHAADGWMASATDWVLTELASLILLAVRGIGYIMLMLVQGLIQVLQYTNFTNPGPTAVQIGWVVTRDLSNMFFIVMLMVIALSTAIGWPENYHYSKQLRSLLIVAVMINFSKTITGLIIDAGQVIMMTFVNGIADAAGGNFLNAFQIGKLLQLKSAGAGASATDAAGLVLGAALALVMVIIATCVILALLVMMVYRIVYLWVLIIMSPIAFLSRSVPPFASKYAEWWKELKQYVISGPTAAFFIWLALMIGQVSGGQVAQSSGIGLANGTAGSTEAQSLASANGVSGIPTEAGQTDVFLSMIITTALLLAGMKEASKSGFDLGVSKYLTGKMKGAGNAIKSAAWRNTGGRATQATLKGVGSVMAQSRFSSVAAVGRMTAMKGESMRNERQKSSEKRFGSLEDLARLSPDVFAKNAVKAKGKDADRYAQTILKDKNAQKQFAFGKDDTEEQKKQKTAMQQVVFGNLEDAKKKDSNLGKGSKDFQNKFWQNLTPVGSAERKKALSGLTDEDMGRLDEKSIKEAIPDMDGRHLKTAMENNAQAVIAGLGNLEKDKDYEKLAVDIRSKNKGISDKEVSTRLQEQFLRDKGVDEATIPKEMYKDGKGNLVEGVARYAYNESKADPKSRAKMLLDEDKATALRSVANEDLKRAMAAPPGVRDNEVSKAVVAGINVGSITDAIIKGNQGIQEALRKGMDAGTLARGASNFTPEQSVAARTAMAFTMEGNTDRIKNYNRNDMYDAIRPSEAEVARITGQNLKVEGPKVDFDFDALSTKLSGRIDELQAKRQEVGMTDVVASGKMGGEVDALKSTLDEFNALRQEYSQQQIVVETAKTNNAPDAEMEKVVNELKNIGGKIEGFGNKNSTLISDLGVSNKKA